MPVVGFVFVPIKLKMRYDKKKRDFNGQINR
jgi:hypothetical protein